MMPALRESAADCLRDIVTKGMEPQPKIELVESLAKMLETTGVLFSSASKVRDLFCAKIVVIVIHFVTW